MPAPVYARCAIWFCMERQDDLLTNSISRSTIRMNIMGSLLRKPGKEIFKDWHPHDEPFFQYSQYERKL